MASEQSGKQKRPYKPLSVEQILVWAKSHFQHTGRWPTAYAGRVADAPEEGWYAIDIALRKGNRGLPASLSLYRLLRTHVGYIRSNGRTILTIEQVLAWMQAHHRRKGRWPQIKSGEVQDVSGETWNAIDQALRHGNRGLPPGLSLHLLKQQNRWI
jgi:hypothetical protein